MKRASNGSVLREFQHLIDPGTVAGLRERDVLARFVEDRDPIAFKAIVTRHGPMVLSVCRQMLRDANDVDDAFQATFVILIKKAGSLRQPDRLGPWLYGVAYRVASRARNRRRPGELPEDMAGPRFVSPLEERERLDGLHAEIQLLPEKYRLPVVLCCLEGLTHDQAARQLGWPKGTIDGRLSRAREMLGSRLSRRGVSLSSGIAGAIALLDPGRSVLPETLRWTTVALSSGTVPARLGNLIKGALLAMFIEKLKATGLILTVAAVGLACGGSVLLAYQAPAAKRDDAPKATSTGKLDPTAPEGSRPKADQPRSKTAYIVTSSEVEAELRSAESLEKLRAQAELLEMNVEQQKTAIQERLVEIHQISQMQESDIQGWSEVERAKKLKELELKQDTAGVRLENEQKQYIRSRVELARLKTQISRASKELGGGDDRSQALADQNRRLDRLEAKVDRILKTLSEKKNLLK